MTPKRRSLLVHPLVLALLLGAVAPCGLLEVAAASFCTEPLSTAAPASDDAASPADATSESGAGDEAAHLDCCAGCLTCCASYTETAAPGSITRPDAALQTGYHAGREFPGSLLSIWRPPRVGPARLR